MLRLPPQLHARLRVGAATQGLSLNHYCVELLRRGAESAAGIDPALSDVDLLIVLARSEPVTRELYRAWAEKLGRRLPSRLAPQFVALPAVLRMLREEILCGRIERRLVHGQPYWIRPEAARGKSA